jgi:hypothetical protein
MSQIIITRRRSGPLAVLLLVLASLMLAACGSSSSSPASSVTSASATTSKTGGPTGGAGSRFTALRECLQKDGITLPKRAPGKPAGGFLSGAGPTLPKGVTRAQYLADIKKCGGAGFNGGFRFRSPAFRAALVKFSACMRAQGVNVPSPNTGGKGPIFNSKGLNTKSATFKAAEAKCSPDLEGVLVKRGSNGGPPTGVPPGAGGSPPGAGGAGTTPAPFSAG